MSDSAKHVYTEKKRIESNNIIQMLGLKSKNLLNNYTICITNRYIIIRY
jgi:hypothetical protein